MVERLWPDSTIVCLASGPSLTQKDVDACKGHKVIAVNDTHRLAPWADVLYSSDRQWWEYHRGVPTFQGQKFGMKPLRPHPTWNITVFRNAGESGLSLDPAALSSGRNSGYAAINLAVLLGASRVILLGYDMQKTGKRAHFFGDHPNRLRRASAYPFYRKLFGKMVPHLTTAGVEVINCSRATALEAFPRKALADVLSMPVESAA